MPAAGSEEAAGSAPDRPWAPVPLRTRHYVALRSLLEAEVGLRLPPTKRPMLQARLQKRLRQLGLGSFDLYLDRLQGAGGEELACLVDLVTTHKTEFFREPEHFRLLVEQLLPGRWTTDAPFRLWSAGCSTGEEVWSLAMTLDDHAAGRTFELLGTDVSEAVVDRARHAIYPAERAASLPDRYRRRYLLRSRDRQRAEVRVVPELRARARFQPANLLDAPPESPRFDAIFCRNVMIYFDRETRLQVARRLLSRLEPGGWFFVGHAESLAGLGLPVEAVAPAAYRLRG